MDLNQIFTRNPDDPDYRGYRRAALALFAVAPIFFLLPWSGINGVQEAKIMLILVAAFLMFFAALFGIFAWLGRPLRYGQEEDGEESNVMAEEQTARVYQGSSANETAVQEDRAELGTTVIVTDFGALIPAVFQLRATATPKKTVITKERGQRMKGKFFRKADGLLTDLFPPTPDSSIVAGLLAPGNSPANKKLVPPFFRGAAIFLLVFLTSMAGLLADYTIGGQSAQLTLPETIGGLDQQTTLFAWLASALATILTISLLAKLAKADDGQNKNQRFASGFLASGIALAVSAVIAFACRFVALGIFYFLVALVSGKLFQLHRVLGGDKTPVEKSAYHYQWTRFGWQWTAIAILAGVLVVLVMSLNINVANLMPGFITGAVVLVTLILAATVVYISVRLMLHSRNTKAIISCVASAGLLVGAFLLARYYDQPAWALFCLLLVPIAIRLAVIAKRHSRWLVFLNEGLSGNLQVLLYDAAILIYIFAAFELYK